MDYSLKISKENGVPVYRQIIEQITTDIQNGVLKAGDQLPPERDLAASLGVARGTITKAYQELERDKVIEVTQGRGCFVALEQDVHVEGRKESAVGLINELVDRMEQMKFSYREISTLFQVILMERQQTSQTVHVAAIDCNPEALSILANQLRYISHTKIYKFLLDDVLESDKTEETFREYDLILTTGTHYEQIIAKLPGLSDKMIRLALSPSQQTIIDLAKVKTSAQVAVLGKSEIFCEIIRSRLEGFQIEPATVSACLEQDADFYEILQGMDMLIMPPDIAFEKGKSFVAAAADFSQKGGRIIRFNYQIDKGTLIRIEEEVSKILSSRKQQM